MILKAGIHSVLVIFQSEQAVWMSGTTYMHSYAWYAENILFLSQSTKRMHAPKKDWIQ